MANDLKRIPEFDDIVFEIRNREENPFAYGSQYQLISR